MGSDRLVSQRDPDGYKLCGTTWLDSSSFPFSFCFRSMRTNLWYKFYLWYACKEFSIWRSFHRQFLPLFSVLFPTPHLFWASWAWKVSKQHAVFSVDVYWEHLDPYYLLQYLWRTTPGTIRGCQRVLAWWNEGGPTVQPWCFGWEFQWVEVYFGPGIEEVLSTFDSYCF